MSARRCALDPQPTNRKASRHHTELVRWVDERTTYLCRRCREELGIEETATTKEKEEDGNAQR